VPRVEPQRFRSLMVIAVTVPVLLLTALAIVLTWEVRTLLAAYKAADHSSTILAELTQARLLFSDRQRGIRGYLLTGDQRFLEPYERAGQQLPAVLAALEERLSGSQGQRARLEELRKRWQDWERVADRELALYPDGDYRTIVRQGHGKARMDAIRWVLDGIEDLERQRATLTRNEAEHRARFVLWSGATWLLGVAALLAWGSRRQLLVLSREYEVTVQQLTDQAEALRASEARLEARVAQRTAELTHANQELESFSYSVSHDLRAPLRAIDGFSQALIEDEGERLSPEGRQRLQRTRAAATRMGQLIDDLLQLSRVSRSEMRRERVDLSALARDVAEDLKHSEPGRDVKFNIAEGLKTQGDARLLRVALENLLGNAWKFTSRCPAARIEFFAQGGNGHPQYAVRDNGVGFNMAYAGKLFSPFQRLHKATDFPGTGIGLATVQRIVHRHGGHIEAEAGPGAGATFRFTLGEARP
jgi:signal transduction histidine kinase